MTGVRVSCQRAVPDSRSEDELTLEERAEAVVAAFNLRSTLASDWARPAPCELYRVLEEDPDYRTLVTGMRGVGRLPPPEEACSRPWKERSAEAVGEVLWLVGGVSRSGDTVRVGASVNSPNGAFHSEVVTLVPVGSIQGVGYSSASYRVGRHGYAEDFVIDSAGDDPDP